MKERQPLPVEPRPGADRPRAARVGRDLCGAHRAGLTLGGIVGND